MAKKYAVAFSSYTSPSTYTVERYFFGDFTTRAAVCAGYNDQDAEFNRVRASANSNRIATITEGGLRAYDLDSLTKIFDNGDSTVRTDAVCAISNDGDYVAIADGETLNTYNIYTGAVYPEGISTTDKRGIAFAPDGQHLILVGDYATTIYDLVDETSSTISVGLEFGGMLWVLPDSDTFIVAGGEYSYRCSISAGTSVALPVPAIDDFNSSQYIAHAVSPNGNMLALLCRATDNNYSNYYWFYVYGTSDWSLITSFTDIDVSDAGRLVFSGSGASLHHIVGGYQSGSARSWDTSTWALETNLTLTPALEDWDERFTISEDGLLLTALVDEAGFTKSLADFSTVDWSTIATTTPFEGFSGFLGITQYEGESVTGGASLPSPLGTPNYFGANSSDMLNHVWAVVHGPLGQIEANGYAHPMGSLSVIGPLGQVGDVAAKVNVAVTLQGGVQGPLGIPEFVGSPQILVYPGICTVDAWEGFQRVYSPGRTYMAYAVHRLSNSDVWVSVYQADGQILPPTNILDALVLSVYIPSPEVPSYGLPLKPFAFANDEKTILIGHKLYDIPTQTLLHTYPEPPVGNNVVAVAISPDLSVVAIGWSEQVTMYDHDNNVVFRTRQSTVGDYTLTSLRDVGVRVLAISPDNKYLAVGTRYSEPAGYTGYVFGRIYNTETEIFYYTQARYGTELWGDPGISEGNYTPTAIRFSPDGKWLAFAATYSAAGNKSMHTLTLHLFDGDRYVPFFYPDKPLKYEPINPRPNPEDYSGPFTVYFTPDSQYLITHNSDDTAVALGLTTETPVECFFPCDGTFRSFTGIPSPLGQTPALFGGIPGPETVEILVEDSITLNSYSVFRGSYRTREHLILTSPTTARVDLNALFSDTLTLSDPARFTLKTLLAETLNLADLPTEDIYRLALAAELLVVSEAVSPLLSVTPTARDELTTQDRAPFALGTTLSDSAVLTDTAITARLIADRLREALGISDDILPTLTVAQTLLEQLIAEDIAAFVRQATASEVLALADELTTAIIAQLTAPEALSILDEVASSLVVLRTASEDLALDVSGAMTLTAQLLVGERLAFIGRLPLGEEVFSAWVLNTDTLGATSYTQFPMLALATHQGRTYGLTETGLYELTGETDDGEPIQAAIETGDLALALHNDVNIPRAYLYLWADGAMRLRTVSSKRGCREEAWYDVVGRDGADDQARIVRLARGVRGTTWQLRLENVDGCDFDLRGAEVLPVVLNKRGARS